MTLRHATISIALLICPTLILLYFFPGNSSASPVPRVEKGVLDLRQWQFQDQGPVKLDGQWAFYWHHLYPPEKLSGDSPPTPSGFMDVPGIWNKQVVDGQPLTGDGFATYRLTVFLNPDFCDLSFKSQAAGSERADNPYRSMGLRFMFVETAFTVFVNGQKVTAVGTVGPDRSVSRPRYFPHTAGFLTKGNQLDIVIQVSNFHHRKGGIESPILLGCETDVHMHRQKSLYIDIFLFSSIIIMGFYYLGIFLLRKKELGPFYFSLLCFSVAVRSIVVGDYFILTVFPNIPWEILLKIEYLTFILPVVLFSLFLHRLFPVEINRTAMRIYLGISALLALFVIITAVRIFSWIIIPFQVLLISWCSYLLYVLILAVKRKRRGSIFLLLGGMALFLSGLNDILYNNLILHTGMLLPLGMFVFILFQALVMAQRSSIAYFQVEELSTNLERQVKQRTGELLHKNNQLKQLLHILCHDLQNPLANIRSIIDLSLADPKLFTEMAPYAATAVENGLAIIELIRGIRVLEDKPLTLSLESLNLLKMVTASEQLLSQQITRKKITIEKKIDSDIRVKVERTSFVNSVLNNILTNAIKYSFEGGLIRIEASRENGHIVLSIIDTGIGMPQMLLEDLFNLEKSISRNGTAGETGTGFGMPLVRTLVTAYGGVVDAISREKQESAAEHGTEVRLVLNSG